MHNTVQSRKLCRMVSWMCASVSGSTLAVASSSTSTRCRASSARPRHSSCRWPTLRSRPPSATGRPSRPGAASTRSARCTWAKASQQSASVLSSSGSRLDRTVPWKSTGSWGMIASRRRKVCRPSLPVSTPSIHIDPASGSTRRNSAAVSELLPAPVRPTTPTRARAGTANRSPRSTGRCMLGYRRTRSLTSSAPASGHPGRGRASRTSAGASCSREQYSSARSMELTLISIWACSRMVNTQL
mmetsp:Transcript_6596/g.10886  ORF Transcript_6596/g.10886 Transcript_6596/m.10886 type:complete len:243 (-) Transcript_6596:807-1535(-)